MKRCVRRPGCAGVPVRGHDHAPDSELGGSSDADGGAARLERRGGKDAVVLDEQPRHTELATQVHRCVKRRHALPEAESIRSVPDRQQLGVPPSVAARVDSASTVMLVASSLEVVARQQRRGAGRAQVVDAIRLQLRRATGALQGGQCRWWWRGQDGSLLARLRGARRSPES